MDGHIVIATPALSDAAVLAANGASEGMPLVNLQRMQPIEVWRTTDPANAFVTVDLGASETVSLVALLHTNASAAATWRIRAAAVEGDVVTSPAYDSTSVSLWPTAGLDTWPTVNGLLWLGASPQTLRYWRIDVADGSNPDGFFQAGRLLFANAWQPARNISYGWGLGWSDPSPKPRSLGGQTYPVRRPRARQMSFRLDFQSEAALYDNAFEIDRLRGTADDLLVVRDPTNVARLQQWAVHGTLDGLAPIINSQFSIFSKDYTVSELL